jgi:hypothetical protein
LSIVHASAEALDANLSGVDFVPVGGLAKSYPFDSCRNPMARMRGKWGRRTREP